MSGDESNKSDFFYDSSGAPKQTPKATPSRPLEAAPAPVGIIKPRLKHANTPGHRAPSGSTLAPPRPNPLPSRGSGVFLFLNLTAAVIALIFAVLLAIKI
jgi:hypothetical protein